MLDSAGGIYNRKNGTGDDWARRTVDLVKGDSEIKRATKGCCDEGDTEVGNRSVVSESTEPSGDDSGMKRCSTPSNSRTYFGLVFLFSALHCAITRIRLCPLLADAEGSVEGSHHHPRRSIPPSDLPPTRRRDIDMWLRRMFRERSSKAVPRCVVDTDVGEMHAVDIRRRASDVDRVVMK